MHNMKDIKHYITSQFPKLGFVKELQGGCESVKNKLPFEESLFTQRPYLQCLWAACTRPILINGGILKYQNFM